MDKFIKLDIKTFFADPKKKRLIDKYAKIMQTFSPSNVATSRDFQKSFNGFYRVRRNSDWQRVYYDIMESGKDLELNFENVLRTLYEKTGNVEASFSSKLLHTLNNDMPIWDTYVLQNLNLKPSYCHGEKKIQNTIFLYQQIVQWYEKALQNIEITQKLLEFDDVFPEYTWFSKTKKLDFLLWQVRD